MSTEVRCYFCNKISTTAKIEHILPNNYKNQKSPYLPDNFITICQECNNPNQKAPTEHEFINFLTELMWHSGQYREIAQEAIIGKSHRYRADILANQESNSKNIRLLIECRISRPANLQGIYSAIDNLKSHKEAYGECQLILATPSTLKEEEINYIKAAGIQLWDLDFLAYNFGSLLDKVEPSHFTSLLLKRVERGPKPTREDELSDKIKQCDPGQKDWSLYQALIGDILEHLFCPTLNKPIPEHADSSKTNRRDFVMANYAESGFWHFLQRNYMADYIIVDAKNYAKKIRKGEVLQIANYLKPHGAGLFGMIFSRHGCDTAGGVHTLREQWMIHRKLILVFNDEDVHSMLIAKRDGGRPEDIVEQKIEHFRLSL